MGGANLCLGQFIPKPIQKHKPSLKNFATRVEAAVATRARGQATSLKDGSRRGTLWSHECTQTRLGAARHESKSTSPGHSGVQLCLCCGVTRARPDDLSHCSVAVD